MAASSKPTGVHYALLVFVLISIVCGLGWLLSYKGANSLSESRRELDEAKKKAATDATALNTKFDELKNVKNLLGSKFEEIGDPANPNPNSVLGDMAQHMKNHNQGGIEPTYNGMIVKLAEALRNTTAARDNLQTQLETERNQFEQKLNEARAELAAEKKARETADKGKVDADNIHKEEVASKESENNELKTAISRAQQDADEYKESAEKQIADLKGRNSNLIGINKRLSGELDEKTRISFEIPDGQIVSIDPVARTVWVNLGEAEGLKPRTTFSVYKKSHSGVGRGTVKGTIGAEDIKGSIEITRVMSANLAEARILNENIYTPMARGDPIYSPLWSPGRGETFSIVGAMDLDGDGKGDPALFREMIATVGASIDNEVTEKGELFVNGEKQDDGKPRVTEKTKFLVIGKIPEIADTADPDEIATIQKILTLRKDLEDAARERGVRVVSLGDFLSYIGFKSQRRLFVPGGEAPWNLKSGAKSTAVNEATGSSRQSTGSTSQAYSGDKSQKPKNTKPNTKVFRK